MKIKQTKYTFKLYWVHVFTIDKETLAVLDKFLASFYVLKKVNFQNYFANTLTDG